MNDTMKAAFIASQVACFQAKLVAMQEQNAADRSAGRSITYQPYDFENLPDTFGLGHNAVVQYLMGD